MKLLKFLSFILIMSSAGFATAQETESTQQERKAGHLNNNRFKQLYQEFSSPNQYRSASGAPGPAYYQQQADYKMNIVIDDATQMLTGDEVITYTNNSPDALSYLWLQLDQNLFSKTSDTKLIQVEKMEDFRDISQLKRKMFDYDGGFKIEDITSLNGANLKYSINQKKNCDRRNLLSKLYY